MGFSLQGQGGRVSDVYRFLKEEAPDPNNACLQGREFLDLPFLLLLFFFGGIRSSEIGSMMAGKLKRRRESPSRVPEMCGWMDETTFQGLGAPLTQTKLHLGKPPPSPPPPPLPIKTLETGMRKKRARESSSRIGEARKTFSQGKQFMKNFSRD